MSGRQRLRQREERSEAVRALLGIGPDALSPFSPPFPFCRRAAATAGALCQSRGVPLPLRHTATISRKKFAGSGCSNSRSSKVIKLTAGSPLWPPSLPPPPPGPSPHQEPWWPPYPALWHCPPPLPENFPGWKMHEAPASLQVLGEMSPCPPESQKHNPCRNTASTGPTQAETMSFCFCFPSRQGKAAPWPPFQRERQREEWKEKKRNTKKSPGN